MLLSHVLPLLPVPKIQTIFPGSTPPAPELAATTRAAFARRAVSRGYLADTGRQTLSTPLPSLFVILATRLPHPQSGISSLYVRRAMRTRRAYLTGKTPAAYFARPISEK